jgi:tRNA modification GTPase
VIHVNIPNRAIHLTGSGVSALATVRLLGPNVGPFLTAHFSRQAQPGGLVHGELRDESGVIDDPVVALAPDSSYVDITLHGGVWVVQSLLELAKRAGFLLVNGDDHPRMCFPESPNEVDAEVRVALPRARTERAVRTVLAQEVAWRELLASRPDRASIEIVLGDHSLQHLLHPPTVAIIGLPNAGKSTLANQLFGTERSIVSPVAGTTRDWVGEEANLDGLIVKLLDTPGRHETDDPIERQAIAQSDSPVSQANLVIVLMDCTVDDPRQYALRSRYPDALAILNKIDHPEAKFNDSHAAKLRASAISAETGEGLSALVADIHARFGIGRRPAIAPRWWTDRQRQVLERSVQDPSHLATIFAAT